MRAGYKVEHLVVGNVVFIIVGNYSGSHILVVNYGYTNEESFKKDINEFDIGFWRIKRKETIKAK